MLLFRIGVVIHVEKPLRMMRIEDLMVGDIAGEDDPLTPAFKDIGAHACRVARNGKVLTPGGNFGPGSKRRRRAR